MGMFILTDGHFYVRNGNSKREYIATNKIEEAIKVTRREGNSILNKKTKMPWLSKYRLIAASNIIIENENISENINEENSNNVHNYKGKADIYTGDNKVEINEEIITYINDIVDAINNINLDKNILDDYIDKLSSMLSYYDSVLSDISHIIKYNNPSSVAKSKIYDIEHDIENKRSEVKQTFVYVQLLLNGINNNWSFSVLHNKLSNANWKEYKARTDYYDMLLNIISSDNAENDISNNNPIIMAEFVDKEKENKIVDDIKITKLKNNKKSVCMYDINGKYIKEYDSISSAASDLGVQTTSISRCCSGKQKTSAGYIWKFKEVV